jgi:heptosyltransferase-2
MQEKILIVAPNWLGDLINAQSLFKLLKAERDCILHVLASSNILGILNCMPEVDKCWELPIKRGTFALKQRYKIAQVLKTENYHQAIILPNSWKAALVPFLAGIPHRTGYVGECRWGLINDLRFFNKAAPMPTLQHYASLGVAAHVALPVLTYPKLVAPTGIQLPAISGKPILALCPGAAFGMAKCWPSSYYARLAELQAAKGWEVWLFGAQHDYNIGQAIASICAQKQVPLQNFIGQLPITTSTAYLALAQQVVSNDSGLMHLAAALNLNLIAIFGSTSPALNPPLSDTAKVIYRALTCSPCKKRLCPLGHNRCMRDITPEEIAELCAY